MFLFCLLIMRIDFSISWHLNEFMRGPDGISMLTELDQNILVFWTIWVNDLLLIKLQNFLETICILFIWTMSSQKRKKKKGIGPWLYIGWSLVLRVAWLEREDFKIWMCLWNNNRLNKLSAYSAISPRDLGSFFLYI